jgi:hypothetical protein
MRGRDGGGDEIGTCADDNRRQVAVPGIECKAGGARSDQRADRHARVQNVDDAADVASAEIAAKPVSGIDLGEASRRAGGREARCQ